MGHWSYLVVNQTQNPNYYIDWYYQHDNIQIIMAAKYAIPPLWYSVFQESDLKSCTLKLRNDETLHRPVYITPTEVGIQRAINKRSRFCNLFSEDIGIMYDKWLESLNLFNCNYIHMDWNDVASMGEAEEMNASVQSGIRAFDSDLPTDWNNCFSNCAISFDVETKLAHFNPHTKDSPHIIERDLFGNHFIKKINRKGMVEWVAENNEKENSVKKTWWIFWK